jgi:hypothetical protein
MQYLQWLGEAEAFLGHAPEARKALDLKQA